MYSQLEKPRLDHLEEKERRDVELGRTGRMGWLYSVLIPRCPLDDKERVRPFISFIAFSGFISDLSLMVLKTSSHSFPFYSHPFCHVAWCSGYLGCCGHMSICVLEACVYNLYREPYGASAFIIHLTCCRFAKEYV